MQVRRLEAIVKSEPVLLFRQSLRSETYMIRAA